MDGRTLGDGCLQQNVLHAFFVDSAVKGNPVIFPGIPLVRLIVDHFSREDTEGTACGQQVAGAGGMEDSLSGTDVNEKIIMPDMGNVKLAGRAVLVSAEQQGQVSQLYVVKIVLYFLRCRFHASSSNSGPGIL